MKRDYSVTVTTHPVPNGCGGRGDGHLQEVDSEVDDGIGHVGLMDCLQHKQQSISDRARWAHGLLAT